MSQPISNLRRHMIEDMKIRNMSSLTQAAYVRAVKNFSAQPFAHDPIGARQIGPGDKKTSAVSADQSVRPSVRPSA